MISDLTDLQAGVVSRRQLLDGGLASHDVKRLIRRRELHLVHPGVYAVHNGPLPWISRAWSAVLLAWPAALSHQSAVRAACGPGWRTAEEDRIHVAIDWERRLRQVPTGIVVHRSREWAALAQFNTSPPRIRLDHAVIDVAALATSDHDLIAAVAKACGTRRTTADRLLKALSERQRISHRALMSRVLTDVADGTNSVLEHAYLTRVERPHGLPRGVRQKRVSTRTGVIYLDVDYDGYDLVVEIDGRSIHDEPTQRSADLSRDLDAVVAGKQPVRVDARQVTALACTTAVQIGQLLQLRGWTGTLSRCPRCPTPGGRVGGR